MFCERTFDYLDRDIAGELEIVICALSGPGIDMTIHLSLEKTSLFTCVAAIAVRGTSVDQSQVRSPCRISSCRRGIYRRYTNRPTKS